MIKCKELNREFSSKTEMFKALKEHKQEIINLKKAAVKRSDGVPMLSIKESSETIKGLTPKDELKFGDYVYPVINTTKYLDSHGDVHLDGIWDRSANEQAGKVYLLINHDLSVGKVISQPKDVEPMVKDIAWKDLGKNYPGNTQALIFKAKISEKSNKDGFLAYKDNDPVEHSIRMQYVKLDLAVNSDDKELKEEKKLYDSIYPEIANKELADEQGYFWAVSEAKIYKEGSMVLAGSNDATPTLYDLEAGTTTSNKEAATSTSEQVKFFTNLI